jgi:hypothetical protein
MRLRGASLHHGYGINKLIGVFLAPVVCMRGPVLALWVVQLEIVQAGPDLQELAASRQEGE